jgi:tRNA/tmRNA/rRNA uracil-C5-methylase (TrmA/RlmC/RlmD family)
MIKEGYKLEKLAMVDMFPHTPHIETVVLLAR